MGCVAVLGTGGCEYEQPLEASLAALTRQAEPGMPNEGFLRNDSLLAIIYVTDEDDCSASNPQLYDNTQTDINSTLGPLTSYRCFEFGITCDVNELSLDQRFDRPLAVPVHRVPPRAPLLRCLARAFRCGELAVPPFLLPVRVPARLWG